MAPAQSFNTRSSLAISLIPHVEIDPNARRGKTYIAIRTKIYDTPTSVDQEKKRPWVSAALAYRDQSLNNTTEMEPNDVGCIY